MVDPYLYTPRTDDEKEVSWTYLLQLNAMARLRGSIDRGYQVNNTHVKFSPSLRWYNVETAEKAASIFRDLDQVELLVDELLAEPFFNQIVHPLGWDLNGYFGYRETEHQRIDVSIGELAVRTKQALNESRKACINAAPQLFPDHLILKYKTE